MRTRIAALLVLAGASGTAQDTSLWRFWDARDGMAETFTQTLAMDARGHLWAVHGGAVGRISINDGYGIRQLPSPGLYGRVFASLEDEDIWAVTGDGLARLEGGQWIPHPIPGFKPEALRDPGLVAVPGSRGKVLLVTPEGLLEYRADTRKGSFRVRAAELALGPFINAISAADGGVWITAERGLAKVAELSGGRPRWRGYASDLPDIGGFGDPYESSPGVLTMTGSRNRPPAKAVVQFDGQRWRVLEVAETNAMRGWFDNVHALWIQRDSSLSIRAREGEKEAAMERRLALSGTYNDLLHESPAAFWLATTHGVARYAPALWSAPAADTPDLIVNAIVEDRDGRIWSAGDDSLFCLDGGRWRQYRTMGALKVRTLRTGALLATGDGRIVYLSIGRSLESLDPRSGRILAVVHPAGRAILAADRQPDGNLDILSQDPATGAHFFETFDGSRFTTIESMGKLPDKHDDIRAVLRASDGAIWFGGSGLAGVYRQGRTTVLDAGHGFPGRGAFTIFEPEPGRILIGDFDRLIGYDGKRWTVLHSGDDRVRRIIRARDGTIWAASSTGIHRLKDGELITNDSNEGLASDIAYTVFEDSQGRIWAGTARGLSIFNPQADTDPPRTLLSEAQNQRQVVPSGDATFTFSGVDKWKHTDSGRLLFACRVDGAPWGPFQSGQSAAFRRLSVGKHRFEVKAMDRNGNADPTGAAFDFQVLAPWYRHGGFLAILFVSAATIASLLLLAARNYSALRRAKLAAEEAERAKGERLIHEQELNLVLQREIEERKLLECQLVQAQKLESIGQLAAGIAHELNTPIQYVSDNCHFLDRSFSDLDRILGRHLELLEAAKQKGLLTELVEEIRQSHEEFELDYLRTEIPGAIGQCHGGLQRVAAIVRAMKEFAHPGSDEMRAVDLNHSIENTLAVCRNEWKSVADATTDLDPDLPSVTCFAGEINQVVLNLVVNAAHALALVQEPVRQGKIKVSTRKDGDSVEIRVEDNGSGIPRAIRTRIFDPFFTTKDVGKGTGQGLALARNVIVKRHAGTIAFETEEKIGTTFIVRFPIAPAPSPEGAVSRTCVG